jgi:hypothetical protein
MSEHHCYACNFSWGYYGFDQPGWRDVQRAQDYERCLEAVESASKQFSISGLWRTKRDDGSMWGPRDYNMLRIVVKDLATHGLIVCVHRTPNGKCRLWQKV